MTAKPIDHVQADRYTFWAGNKALISNANKETAESSVTSTELGYLSGVTGNVQDQIDSISKSVFNVGPYSTAQGWIKLGTFTLAGGGSTRWNVQITGKQGWNDQNYPGLAILHGSSNYVGADSGQINAGCAWLESPGTGVVADKIALVRQAGYALGKFDLYIILDLAFTSWMVEVTVVGTGKWAKDIQVAQTDPGTGTNVFLPTKQNIVRATVTPTNNYLPKWSSGYLVDSLWYESSGELRTGAMIRHVSALATDPVLALQVTGENISQFVLYKSGLQEWGAGATARDTNLYRSAANRLQTDDVFGSALGFRATGYSTTPLAGDGPGIEMHYDTANTRARVLAYDRTAAARIRLDIDGSPINFYANNVLKGSFDASGNFNLANLTASRALVSDASKNVVSSSVTSTELGYLSGVTSAIQTQLNGKWTQLDTRITDDANNTGNLNRITDVASSASNNPGASTSYLINIRNNAASTTYQGQIAVTSAAISPQLAIRNNYNGTWTAWKYALMDADNPDLVAIEALTGTSGFLKKTAANTWALDTNTYMAVSDYPDLTAIEALTGTSGVLKKTAANTWALDTALDSTHIPYVALKAALIPATWASASAVTLFDVSIPAPPSDKSTFHITLAGIMTGGYADDSTFRFYITDTTGTNYVLLATFGAGLNNKSWSVESFGGKSGDWNVMSTSWRTSSTPGGGVFGNETGFSESNVKMKLTVTSPGSAECSARIAYTVTYS